MHPFWHSLTLFVPIYNLFRMHAHFRTIRDLRASRELPESIAPGLAVICWMLANGIGWQSARASGLSTGTEFILDTVAVLLSLVIVVGGQSALNGYWQSWRVEGREIPARHGNWAEWLAMIIGGLLFMLEVIGAFAS